MSDYADKNELYHWLKGKEKSGHKYTSRYMKNGKWRYNYTDKYNYDKGRPYNKFEDWLGLDEKSRAEHELREQTRISKTDQAYKRDQLQSLHAPDWGRNANIIRSRVLNDGGYSMGSREIHRYTKEQQKRTKEAIDAYNKTPLAKIEKAKRKTKIFFKTKVSRTKRKISQIAASVGDSFEEHIGRKLAAYSKNKKKQKNQNRSRKKLKKNAAHGSRRTLDNNKKEISYAVYEKRPRPM